MRRLFLNCLALTFVVVVGAPLAFSAERASASVPDTAGTASTATTATTATSNSLASSSMSSTTSTTSTTPTAPTSSTTSASSTTSTSTTVPGPYASMGYVMATTHGAVLAYGGVPIEGSAASLKLNQPVISIAATPDGDGYWMAATDGAIFTYGDAHFYGSMGGVKLNEPVVAMAATPDGGGYWEVASDGGIFTFGDAGFYGSMGGKHLVRPVTSMAATPDGGGYWEVASDGGVFTFGDAGFYGSMGGKHLVAPVIGLAPGPQAGGYWEVAQDGGVFSFGSSVYHGAASESKPSAPIVGIGSTPDGGGYWEGSSDGGVFAFGDAPFRGSDAAVHDLFYPVVAFAPAKGSGSGVDNGRSSGLGRYDANAEGYDISWPQCGGKLPPASTVAVVGVNDGHGMSTNPCFATEAAWAGVNMSVYMNADYFSPTDAPPPDATSGPAGTCNSGDLVCEGYNYGWASAAYSVAAERKAGFDTDLWWLDVERGNYWSASTTANASAIQGMLDYLASQGIVAGIYSTPYQFGIIAGNYHPAVPNWFATGSSSDPPTGCTTGFTGGPTWLVQAAWTGSNTSYDGDYAC